MSVTRREEDALGAMELPADCLYGIHTARALGNFTLAGRPVHRALVHAYGEVKGACLAVNHRLGYLESAHFLALDQACRELTAGDLDAALVVDALQGGAGTSTNMNVNEVLANRALQILGLPLGSYAHIDPLDTVNRHQSTNDTYPTALRIAAMRSVLRLERAIVALLEAFQQREQALADIVCLGRTQMRDAVPLSVGRALGAYADALARDRWRIAKCEERLRVVNLGGTAIGTGLGAPRQYIFAVVDELRRRSGLGLARAENLVEATANQDALVEVSGMLSALATTLHKICGDLRLWSSGPDGGYAELVLPARQAGSSIMPEKINPVIPEAAQQAAMRVLSSHQTLCMAVAQGSLQLHPFMPLIADELLGAIDLLDASCTMLAERCVVDIQADRLRCASHLDTASATATALIGELGYHGAQHLATASRRAGLGLREAALAAGLSAERYAELVSPEAVNRLGSELPVHPVQRRGPDSGPESSP